jgi:hypothetical protein
MRRLQGIYYDQVLAATIAGWVTRRMGRGDVPGHVYMMPGLIDPLPCDWVKRMSLPEYADVDLYAGRPDSDVAKEEMEKRTATCACPPSWKGVAKKDPDHPEWTSGILNYATCCKCRDVRAESRKAMGPDYFSLPGPWQPDVVYLAPSLFRAKGSSWSVPALTAQKPRTVKAGESLIQPPSAGYLIQLAVWWRTALRNAVRTEMDTLAKEDGKRRAPIAVKSLRASLSKGPTKFTVSKAAFKAPPKSRPAMKLPAGPTPKQVADAKAKRGRVAAAKHRAAVKVAAAASARKLALATRKAADAKAAVRAEKAAASAMREATSAETRAEIPWGKVAIGVGVVGTAAYFLWRRRAA